MTPSVSSCCVGKRWRRDAKDDKFLEVAVAGEADVIVSRDEDLLALHPFAGIPILPLVDFLQMLEDADERR